ncbi:glycine cleavage system aminomethyltransferase GcvT [Auraticoccus monumenti]|uniref:Aminomethyltransferase n=1 Tax=Auraticoccus monumenti TaxID=675864 RepID=A0A1G7DW64_9ACTN|nr:glycine cleavage system aminomethyltransferase GcvT [Auraticoccus monumenti]SDE55691.1 aminomethyltransferase [Auraticoccus monumenti]
MGEPDDQLVTSPLHAQHERLGARFAAFGGWSMPLEYAGGGVLAEHAAVRSQVGVFDVSHLGKVRVAGPGAAAFLNRCLTNDLDRVGAGQAQYTLLCREDGGVVDDLIAYRHGDDDVFLVPNASNTPAVVATLQALAPEGVQVLDQHRDLVVVAVQGPRSDEVLATAGLPVGHDYMRFVTAELAGTSLTVCRTGYTGERGYELVVPAAAAGPVWEAVLAAGEPYGIQPAGLGARDTLRTEMGYPLHGQDISAEITPVQAGLGWAVGWAKPEFLGHAALRAEKEAGPARRLRGLRARGRGIPRAGMDLVDGEDVIGTVTSGTFSPTLKTGIALALVDASIPVGSDVEVQVRHRRETFAMVKPPFVQPGVREL